MKYRHAFPLAAAAFALQAAPPVLAQVPPECTVVPNNNAQPFFAGPVNPQNGFPEYVRDSNGLSLEICLDGDAGGNPPFCFFDPADPANPFSVQVGFGPEAFWWLAGAVTDTTAGRAEVVLGAEAAWAAEVPNPGDQFPFIRLRIRVDVPVDGDYVVTHPYGISLFEGVTALGGINDTIDIPFVPGTIAPDGTVIDQENQGPAGPWLTWNTFDPNPALTDPLLLGPAGEQYIGDGVTDHLVVGSPCNTNLLRVEGPAGSVLDPADGDNVVETDLFAVQGKLWDGRLGTQVVADRTTYERDAAGGISFGQVDVFATGAPNASVIFSGDANVPPGDILLTGDDPLVPGGFYASELLTPDADIVPDVVELVASDLAGLADPVRLVSPLTDVVTVSRALYNTSTGILLIEGSSSDALVAPDLSVVGFGDPLPARIATVAPPARVTVASAAGGSDTEPVTVVANESPVADDDAVVTDEDVAVAIDVLDGDTDADGTINPATVTIVVSPLDGTAVPDGTGLVTYTPDTDFNGQDSFTYTVEDDTGNLSNEATVTITVNPVNDAPVAVDDAATTTEEIAVTVNVLANDSDVDGDALSVAAVTQPANGTVTNNGTDVTYTPDPGFTGADSFTYTASDGDLEATATVDVTVIPRQNEPPVAVDDSASTDEDTPVTIDVLANDTDPDGDALTFNLVNAIGSRGTVQINGDNTLTYTPNQDFFGTATFTYTITDGNFVSNSATVTVTVNPVNDAPVANPDSASTTPLTPVTIPVLANDTDVENDALSVVTVTQGGQGSVVINPDDTLTYTPNATFAGSDAFTYTVSDGTDTAVGSVVVQAVEGGGVDLDLVRLRVTTSVRLDRTPAIGIRLFVRNGGTLDEPREATVVGTQNGVELYREILAVNDAAGGGTTAFDFPVFDPTHPNWDQVVTGQIDWTATLIDDDPDVDEATAATRVR